MTSYQKLNPSKIIGVQFSILSHDEIRNNSVAEIKSRDTYINNKPVIGGLFDPRMGVLEPGLICPTDGLDYMNTPGYFGHIELARPVFYIQYLATITKIVRCVCFKCSKLKISKNKYKKAFEGLSGEKRWNAVFERANPVVRCGDDIEDGCGCKQPTKIKKEGLANLIAEWDSIEGATDEEKEKLNVKLTPELLIKIFRRISDEDVAFMGFSPLFSRPEWMICKVFAVPPPAVRPSVKHDAQQRSEDDISHIIVNIIKANNALTEKINQNAPANVLDDWTTLLQYYIATLVDNKIPGVASVAQRSGRPLKSIKERLNGKTGRVRGNLMGKRVDYSARSVITPDPNISIRELGIPLKIAKNITKPIVVNAKNKNFLLKLVQNGPDIHPGAKMLEKKNGDNITLRYVDRDSIVLQEGDIVHRHMMNGDGILFNRQPTLHRMSMMCHIARIMPQADTFRMNVADTKPYNADFDGDEMNLHMPQDIESETELKNLAAVPYQIISPANNNSIVGIYQDSLLGSYRLTRENIEFTQRAAMNLLMAFDRPDTNLLFKNSKKPITSFELLGQIMPPITMKYNIKPLTDDENKATSNNVLEIKNGTYFRGQLSKSTLGGSTKGLLQRVCNDYGNMAAAGFVDDLQNIVTEYMKTSSFSVGVSDLITEKVRYDKIIEKITEVKVAVQSIIQETHLGVFTNETGKSNKDEFEARVNSAVDEIKGQASKIGRDNLSPDNRFATMVNAGSKGSDINISQMIVCLGQQTVEGLRIPYGFDDRTLPHFTRYDDSSTSRGFVQNSFIGGLTPEELFFHAMGGRTGLIDTAVKTSQTGYIQRRLIKGLEDIKVEYDMSARNNKGKIVQFKYGNDAFDTVKVEKQRLPLVKMSLDEIYSHFHVPSSSAKDEIFKTCFAPGCALRMKKQDEELMKKNKQMIDFMIEQRENVVKNVYSYANDDTIYIPVAFTHVIDNIQGQQSIQSNSRTDITPLEAYQLIDDSFHLLEKIHYAKPNLLFKIMYYYYISPREIVLLKRFNRKALMVLLETVVTLYKKALIAPGEVVGMIAAQSIGEPTTQMTLNTFHFAGVASKSNVTRGVPRVEEILSLSESTKNPSVTIYLKPEEDHDREKAQVLANMIEHTQLREVVESVEICFDPDDLNTLIANDHDSISQFKEFENMLAACAGVEVAESTTDKSKWVIRMEIHKETMLEKNITMEDVHYAVKNYFNEEVSCVYTDYNSDNLVFRIRLNKMLHNKKKSLGSNLNPLDQSDEIYLLKNFQDNMLDNIVLRGIKNIDKVVLRKDPNVVKYSDGKYNRTDIWVLDTVGSNLLEILGLDYIDVTKTYTNSIIEMYNVFGIEVARQSIYTELTEVIEADGTYINEHHLTMLCDRMTYSHHPISIFRHGINNDDIGPIAKASFEETPEMFLKAARHAEVDIMRGVSANVMCGQEGYYGTSAFQVYLDLDQMKENIANMEIDDSQKKIEDAFGKVENTNDACSTTNIQIDNNVIHIKDTDLGSSNYTIDF